MTTLRDCTRTRINAVVNPGYNFLVDPDLEHHYRALARKEEALAQRENAACFAEDRVIYHANEAIRLHNLANEQRQLHRPTPKATIPPAHTKFETAVILLIALATAVTMIACAVALAGLLARWIWRAM